MKDGNPAPGAAGVSPRDTGVADAHAVALEGVSFTYGGGKRLPGAADT